MRRALALAVVVALGVAVVPADAGRRHHRRSVLQAKVLRSAMLGVRLRPLVPLTSAPASSPSTGPVSGSSTETTTTPAPAPTPEPLPSRTGVSLDEYRVRAARNPVATGAVELTITNYGEDAHDLTVADAGGAIRGQTAEIGSQQAATLTVELPVGDYKLYCSLLDHDARGMHTTLHVQ